MRKIGRRIATGALLGTLAFQPVHDFARVVKTPQAELVFMYGRHKTLEDTDEHFQQAEKARREGNPFRFLLLECACTLEERKEAEEKVRKTVKQIREAMGKKRKGMTEEQLEKSILEEQMRVPGRTPFSAGLLLLAAKYDLTVKMAEGYDQLPAFPRVVFPEDSLMPTAVVYHYAELTAGPLQEHLRQRNETIAKTIPAVIRELKKENPSWKKIPRGMAVFGAGHIQADDLLPEEIRRTQRIRVSPDSEMRGLIEVPLLLDGIPLASPEGKIKLTLSACLDLAKLPAQSEERVRLTQALRKRSLKQAQAILSAVENLTGTARAKKIIELLTGP